MHLRSQAMECLHLAPVQTLLALFSVDDITGFRITQVLELPQPWGILITWGVVLPLVFLIASALTNAVFKDGLILQVAPCPGLQLRTCLALAGHVYSGRCLTPCAVCRVTAPTAARARRRTLGTS